MKYFAQITDDDETIVLTAVGTVEININYLLGLGGVKPKLKSDIRIDYQMVTEIWNTQICHLMRAPQIQKMSDKRQRGYRKAFMEDAQVLEKVKAEAARLGPWAKGQEFLTFDWLFRYPENMLKFLEGSYRETEKPLEWNEKEGVFEEKDGLG